jgi:hypothetical protein
MISFLNILDTTGVKPQFLLSGKKNYTTSLGGLISLLNLIILGLVIYAFGKNFFERTEPLMIQNLIYPERYPNYTLGLNLNFTYAVRLEDFDGNVINRSDLVYIDFIYYHYEIRNGQWVELNKKSLDYELCNKNNFEKPELFDRQGLKTACCPNLKNLEVGGGWDETYIKYIRAFIRVCKEGEMNKKGEKCGKSSDFKHILKNRLFISNYYQEYFVDSDNYQNPMDIVFTNQYYMLDPLILKKSIYFFRKGTVTTDYGWILKDEESYSKFTFDDLVTDSISMSQLPESQQNIIGEVHLKFSKKQEKFVRTYTKIQNLAANVGGIIKIFYTVNIFIASFFTIHLMNFDFLNYLNNKCNLKNEKENSKIIPNTFIGNSSFNNFNFSKLGEDRGHLFNFKIFEKKPVDICEINLSHLQENNHNNIRNLNKHKNKKLSFENKKQNSILFSLNNFLKRQILCKRVHSKSFNPLENKLESILDIKNYISICIEFNTFKKEKLRKHESLFSNKNYD